MIINVHGGHNRIVPGASGLLDEVVEDRAITAKVITKLKALGHTVYDCTDNAGRTQNQNLTNIVNKCNAHNVDLNISIHLNSGGGKGVEVLVYSADSKAKPTAEKICNEIAALGYKNRGVKVRRELAVLRRTKAAALLVECCFVDSVEDKSMYDAEKMASAIVKGVTGQTVAAGTSAYRVRVTASTLNVRADHSASSAVTTKVKRGDIYTIVDEYNNGGTLWGRLKSGAGWIALKYTERV